ncbi:MAG: TetR family transcriptional regulator [Deltaproteobacteria bacterium]|nr:MAG: TetR family transcriptional regulator [Deltaproteobacteria bacterium]
MDTAQRILDVAERLVQTQGFNGFSYADIAAELGITKASLHYHFVTKAALGSALITRYGAEFGRALEEIDQSAVDAREKLRRFARIFEEGRKQGALRFRGSPLDSARLLLGSLEGAMLVARSYGDPERFTSAAQRLLAELSGRRKLTGRTDRARR